MSPTSVLKRMRFVSSAVMLALVLGAVPSPVAAAPPPLPGDCPQITPVANIHAGMSGHGFTVVQGTTVQPFKVAVLGVLPGGVAPGRDMIVVEVSDVTGSDFISRAGGVWQGMSGSPVYVNGKLIGAVAWALSGSTSTIGGLTPAEDMLDILDYGAASASSEHAMRVNSVTLSDAQSRAIAAQAGVSQQLVQGFARLRLPLAVSGLTARARKLTQTALDRAGVPVIVTSGSRAAAPSAQASFVRPEPGGNFAGVISYGDVTSGGIGTTTYVCGNKALAFGHPLLFVGKSSFGANDASALAIVPDLLGSFKLATITDPFGKLVQDRLAGVRARLNVSPASIPITSRITALNLGRSRNGLTRATDSQFVPDIAALHMVSNFDSVIDRVGGGSSLVRFVVTGFANGNAFTLERTNKFASRSDIAYASVDELVAQLAAIESNPYHAVTFTSVDITADVERRFREFTIESVLVSKNGRPFRSVDALQVRPGDNLRLRVGLRQFRGSLEQVTMSLTVPSDATGDGYLQVSGGTPGFFGLSQCLFDHAACAVAGEGKFGALIKSLRNAPRNDDLVADLLFFGFDTPAIEVSSTRRLDRVVQGSIEIPVFVPFD